MSKTVCSYYGCSKSSSKVKGLKMFRFPQDMYRRWVHCSGNSGLIGLSPTKLYKSKRICEDHFRKEDILPSGRLKHNACPTPYVPEDVMAGPSHPPSTSSAPTTPANREASPSGCTVHASTSSATSTPPLGQHPSSLTYFSPTPKLLRSRASPRTYRKLQGPPSSPRQPPSGFPSPAVSTPSATFWIANAEETNPSRPERVKRSLFTKKNTTGNDKRISQLEKKLAVKRAAVAKVKKQLLKMKRIKETPCEIPVKCSDGQVLINMQFHRKRQPWKRNEKRVAISLYLRSPSVYAYLSKTLILPGTSTIKSWISDNDCFKTGFNNKLMQQVQMKVSTMDDEAKACVLMFDEMSIKQGLEYSAQYDLIEGFQDIGIFGRQPVVGKQACVFMVRGLYSQWKIPVGYFISSNGLKTSQTVNLIKESVLKLQEIGLHVKAVVCDQNSTNRSAYSKLGVSLRNPYFLDNNGDKIHALFDVPHLIKSVRNNLLSNNFCHGEKVISFDDIRQLFELDIKSGSTRAVPKLSKTHIKPNNFQKMNVALAAQVLSHSVAAGLRTAVATGQIVSDTALTTAEFLDKTNSLFDVLNSRCKKSPNPDKCALTREHPHVITVLEEASKLFSELEKINSRVKRPPCFDGVRLTIAAVTSLMDQEEGKYIITTRLNQDPIENLFSSIRQRGGWNRNPTVRTFRSALRLYCLKYIIEPPATSSYDADYDTILDLQPRDPDVTEPAAQVPIEVEWHQQSTDEEIEEKNEDDQSEGRDIPEPVSLESCSQAYYAGYLASRTYRKFKCEKCINRHCDVNSPLNNNSDILILEKTFSNITIGTTSGLKAPDPLFLEFVKEAMTVYEMCFKKICHKHKLLSRLLKATNNRVEQLGLKYTVDNGCEEHEKYIQETLFRVLLYKQCKWISDSHKDSSISKIRILHNV